MIAFKIMIALKVTRINDIKALILSLIKINSFINETIITRLVYILFCMIVIILFIILH